MILTGSQIFKELCCGEIKIDPFDSSQLNPNSYDLRLAPEVLIYKNKILDASEDEPYVQSLIPVEGLLLIPGTLYLMRTKERTGTDKYVPGIEGRSSVGRLGISVHATAGFGDVGFYGTWTLEVSCIQPVKIYAGMRICQIFFTQCGDTLKQNRYAGKYLNQDLPRSSQIWKERHEWTTIHK